MSTQQSEHLSRRFGHQRCLLCGPANLLSLGLSFEAHGEAVVTQFQSHDGLQGYEGMLHGGVISAVLDAAMTHCLFHHDIRAVTGELRVHFLHPVPSHWLVDLMARIRSQRRPLFYMEAEMSRAHRVLARAEATFMQCSAEAAKVVEVAR